MAHQRDTFPATERFVKWVNDGVHLVESRLISLGSVSTQSRAATRSRDGQGQEVAA